MPSALSTPPWASGLVLTCLSHSTWAAHSGRDSGGDRLGIRRPSTAMFFGALQTSCTSFIDPLLAHRIWPSRCHRNSAALPALGCVL
ncbi:hypothetical protein B0H15DRAFT_820182 [Mycena belliarum]|uniref:Secreted protein n=1 Tax=Mycena belliarum TaxID=1033014 RepID=A0AAD6UK16_9AGAR|nr:hypothetical protein B0H15DRAFT_820182 [Mycena belliae]